MTTDAGSISNGDSASYWAAAAAGRLEFQRCTVCRNVQFPPRHQCARCWSPAIEPFASGGRGTIESITVVRRAPLPGFRDRVPYMVAAARMAEGPRVIANVVGDGHMAAAIGDAVEVVFMADAEGRTLPRFRLV